MNTFSLVVDVWEGSLEIDESLLRPYVDGFIVRLNDMNGGHHRDKTFDTQWAQVASFARSPYFVYNPWVTGRENYDWLRANMPADTKVVAVDIEVVYPNYAPAIYAQEVRNFLNLTKLSWRPVIYTGGGFKYLLNSWPGDFDYWWAYYPDPAKFAGVTNWAELLRVMGTMTVPPNIGIIPGPLRLWQFCDKLILPGTQRTTDVNLFYGTRAELYAWFGQDMLPQADNSDLVARLAALEEWARHVGYTK